MKFGIECLHQSCWRNVIFVSIDLIQSPCPMYMNLRNPVSLIFYKNSLGLLLRKYILQDRDFMKTNFYWKYFLIRVGWILIEIQRQIYDPLQSALCKVLNMKLALRQIH
jgi:hypothetical protein